MSVGVVLYALVLVVGTPILAALWWRHFGRDTLRVVGDTLRAVVDAFKP